MEWNFLHVLYMLGDHFPWCLLAMSLGSRSRWGAEVYIPPQPGTLYSIYVLFFLKPALRCLQMGMKTHWRVSGT